MQAILLPFYAFVTWLFFANKRLNYAEVLVLFIYSLAFCFLIVIVPNAIDLVPHPFESYYVEIPLLVSYSIWTNLNFFNTAPRWVVVLKSIASLLICWFASNFITNEVIRWMM